jgi:hypothetical protein
MLLIQLLCLLKVHLTHFLKYYHHILLILRELLYFQFFTFLEYFKIVKKIFMLKMIFIIKQTL